MKTVEFKVVRLKEKEPEVVVDIQTILQATSLDKLKKDCTDIINRMKPVEFDYRAQLRLTMRTQSWAQDHPLKTEDDIQIAMDVEDLLRSSDNEVEADSKIVNYLCELAESRSFVPGGTKPTMEAMLEFKKYFRELKESKDVPAKKTPDENGKEKKKKRKKTNSPSNPKEEAQNT